MFIGVPKERKTLEKRVAITPQGVAELAKRGHTVFVERDAGMGAGFTNEEYVAHGAMFCPTLDEVWNDCDLLVKVKEPHESEYKFFRKDLAIFDYLHLSGLPELTEKLIAAKVTGIAYELVQTKDKRLPLLEPMSAIAGRLAILNGAHFLQSQHGGSGMLLGGLGTSDPGCVVVIGAGVAGKNAAIVAAKLGAEVIVLDRNELRLAALKKECNNKITTVASTPESIEEYTVKADLLVGAVLVPGAEPPKLVSRKLVSKMRKGSVIVDISIDQGGCIETMRPTNLDAPVYIEEGIVHYGVCNMPAQTPKTATLELTNVTLPYLLKIADMGVHKAIKEDLEIQSGVATYKGALCTESTGKSLGVKTKSIEEMLG